MKIISKFKDYYDYFSNIYGVDNKCIYNRHLYEYSFLNGKDTILKSKKYDIVHVYNYWDGRINMYPGETVYRKLEFYHLVICGKLFFIYGDFEYGKETKFMVFDGSDPIISEMLVTRHAFYIEKRTKEDFMGTFSEKNLQLNVDMKSPIVIVKPERENLRCVAESPILSSIEHFASMYPAQEIYQDISYFILNQQSGSPDANPPVILDDKYKIEYAGFDRKTSFRPNMKR